MAGIAAPVTRPLKWPTLGDVFRRQWHVNVDRFYTLKAAKLEIASLFVSVPELAEDAKNGEFLIYNADPHSNQGKTPYTTEAEWKGFLEDDLMGFPEFIMHFRGVDEENNPPADQLEWPVPENLAHFCFTNALNRKTYHMADVVSYDVNSLNFTTEAFFNHYQGLRRLIKALFIDVFPIKHFVDAEVYKLVDKDDNKLSKDISKKAWTELKKIKMKVDENPDDEAETEEVKYRGRKIQWNSKASICVPEMMPTFYPYKEKERVYYSDSSE